MKFAITGHTSGIGRGLFERVGGIGISRSTGFDITNAADYKRIRAACDDCDVFINNAHAGFGQSQLLMYLFREWIDTNKTIINVGSRIAEYTEPVDKTKVGILEYWMHKRSLRDTALFLATMDVPIQVTYRSFGYVGTDTILSRYPTLTDYISVEQAVDVILCGLVETPVRHSYIPDQPMGIP